MRILGFPGFVPTGSASWLFDHFGLNEAGIADAVRQTIARKR
jgi:transketolase